MEIKIFLKHWPTFVVVCVCVVVVFWGGEGATRYPQISYLQGSSNQNEIIFKETTTVFCQID